MCQARLAVPNISRYLAEHAWPVISTGDAGDGFRYPQVSGGRIVVETLQYRRPLVLWHALLPLFLGRYLSEVQIVEYVPIYPAFPNFVVRVFVWSGLEIGSQALIPSASVFLFQGSHLGFPGQGVGYAVLCPLSVTDVEVILLQLEEPPAQSSAGCFKSLEPS